MSLRVHVLAAMLTGMSVATVAHADEPSGVASESDAASAAKVVVADGTGVTKEEAVKDACRAAIRQVVGEVVDAETVVENDRLIRDEVLVYSDGLVERHEVTDQRQDGGLVRVTIRATVARRRLVQKLVAAKITVKELGDSGESVVDRGRTDKEARLAAAAIVAKAFAGFPGDQLEARVLDWQPVGEDGDRITMGVRVQIAPSKDAYRAFQERLCQRLKDVAKLDGEFATNMEAHAANQNNTWGDPCRLSFFGVRNHFRDQMEVLMPELQSSADEKGSGQFPFVVAVATLVSGDRTRIDWRYFALDQETGGQVFVAARRPASCKLTFLDDSGATVAVDRFDPRWDQFPLGDGNGSAEIPWNRYLLKCWYREPSSSQRLFLVTEYAPTRMNDGTKESDGRPRNPAFAFIAPLFFDSRSTDNFQYVPQIVMTRHVRLTEEEVRPIKKVQCELRFRNAP